MVQRNGKESERKYKEKMKAKAEKAKKKAEEEASRKCMTNCGEEKNGGVFCDGCRETFQPSNTLAMRMHKG